MLTVPRIVIGSVSSSSGKTTISAGIMRALSDTGLKVQGAKVGPDFIDPTFHRLATSRPPRNLDPFLQSEEFISSLAREYTLGADILVVEGVMGLFDGTKLVRRGITEQQPLLPTRSGEFSSTDHVARLLGAKVILIVDVEGMASSVAPLLEGFMKYSPSIAGVIFNKVGSSFHESILLEAVKHLEIKILGSLYRNSNFELKSRHLGLIPAEENRSRSILSLNTVATSISKSIDLKMILDIAKSAKNTKTVKLPIPKLNPTARIAVASGESFSFTYEDNLEVLCEAGAETIPFNPLTDEHLPPEIDGIYIGGGFPEVFAKRLSCNLKLKLEIQNYHRQNIPIWAECGGLLFLIKTLDGHEMCNIIEAEATMTSKLTLGYRIAEPLVSSPVSQKSELLYGHEFHYSQILPRGNHLKFTGSVKTSSDGFLSSTLFASYLHLHIKTTPNVAENFIASCLREKTSRTSLVVKPSSRI